MPKLVYGLDRACHRCSAKEIRIGAPTKTRNQCKTATCISLASDSFAGSAQPIDAIEATQPKKGRL